jgi:uncharacterized membrane protein YccC
MTDKALAERLREHARPLRRSGQMTHDHIADDLERAADLIESMAQRVPLSDEQIERVRDNCVVTPAEFAGRRYGWAINFARAIEQAHGIRSEK